MVNDDVLYSFRVRLFSLAVDLGNVRAACRIFGIHHSTYYRWRGPVLRSGLEIRFGDRQDLRLKLAIAPRILATVAVGATRGYIDVSVPERPVVGSAKSQAGGTG